MLFRLLAPPLASMAASCSLLPAPVDGGQEITTPAAHLGRALGADFELADWSEVSSYFERLGRQSSRVSVQKVGETTEGRDFLLAAISSRENLAAIGRLQEAAHRIADPRGLDEEDKEALLARAKPFLFISIGMHSTETAAPQFGMEFAHLLATSDDEPFKSAREEMVCLIAPCLNPDGLDHVVSWYRETVGTPYEGSGLLRLYQYYAGHDNNRDWFMLSQNETRIVTRLLYSEWRPQVYWDVHQQGRSRERFFVPPFRDPLNPNLDPEIIAGIGQIGTRALFDMTREGLTGVSTGVTYDMWWNGGNRNVPVRHNIVGLLTEAASVNIASPVFLPKSQLSAPRGIEGYAPSNRFPDPWPGGWWRIRDIIDYEHAFARSLLGSIAREPQLWLQSSLAAAERAIDLGSRLTSGGAPRGWILPADNRDLGAVRRLVDALLLSGVELSVAREEFRADGRSWPGGSIVIRRNQPYGQHVKDLFEVQRYPDGDPPYDVAGWTLPLLMGVHRVEVMGELEVSTDPVETPTAALAGFGKDRASDELDGRDSDSWRKVFEWLAQERGVGLSSEGMLSPVEEGAEPQGLHYKELPRIGVYSPWSGSMDEGWARYVLDTFDVPYLSVRNEMIRAGSLSDFLDVLIIASISGRSLDSGRSLGSVPPEFARGLEPEGTAALDDFVRGGGTLVCLGRSASWAIELFDFPLRDVTRGEDAGDFSCPGSVLRAVPNAENNPHLQGLPGSMAVFFAGSAAWEFEDSAKQDADASEVWLRYGQSRVLLSGWIQNPEAIVGKAAWIRMDHGRGQVHLFGFRPQYRGWSHGTFQLLFRAVLSAAVDS